MINYWPLKEYHFQLTGKDQQQLEKIAADISITADHIRKSINYSANLVVSTKIMSNTYLSFEVVQGQCFVGIFRPDSNKIFMSTDISELGDEMFLRKQLCDLQVQINDTVHAIRHGHKIHTSKKIIQAWQIINKQFGISDNIDILNCFNSHGYTNKDFLPLQKDVMAAYDVYRNEQNIEDIENHFCRLTGYGSILQENLLDPNNIDQEQLYIDCLNKQIKIFVSSLQKQFQDIAGFGPVTSRMYFKEQETCCEKIRHILTEAHQHGQNIEKLKQYCQNLDISTLLSGNLDNINNISSLLNTRLDNVFTHMSAQNKELISQEK